MTGEELRGTMPWKSAFRLCKIAAVAIIYINDRGEATGMSTIRKPSENSVPQTARGFLEQLMDGSFEFVWRKRSHEISSARSIITKTGGKKHGHDQKTGMAHRLFD